MFKELICIYIYIYTYEFFEHCDLLIGHQQGRLELWRRKTNERKVFHPVEQFPSHVSGSKSREIDFLFWQDPNESSGSVSCVVQQMSKHSPPSKLPTGKSIWVKYLSKKKQHTGDELIQDGSGMIPATLYTCVLSMVDWPQKSKILFWSFLEIPINVWVGEPD